MKTDHVYDNYEISGCFRLTDDNGRQFVETCVDDAEAQFWTLYGHITGQGDEAIGDFNSRQDAEEAYYRITGQRFTGSREVAARLRLMRAAPVLLSALTYALEYLRANDDGEQDVSSRIAAGESAIAKATASCPPSEADESYSVLLLYPDYINDSGTESYYALVKAPDPIAAVAVAQLQAVTAAAEGHVEIDDPTDFHPLLVTQGHHTSEALFNK